MTQHKPNYQWRNGELVDIANITPSCATTNASDNPEMCQRYEEATTMSERLRKIKPIECGCDPASSFDTIDRCDCEYPAIRELAQTLVDAAGAIIPKVEAMAGPRYPTTPIDPTWQALLGALALAASMGVTPGGKKS